MNASHTECWQMLPWLVTGRISTSDRQRVERHLLECEACRDELEQQRALCELVRRDDSVMLAPQASLQKLMARIDTSGPVDSDEADSHAGDRVASESALDTQLDAASARAAPSIRAVPRWIAIAAALQTLAIAALLTMIWQQRDAQMQAPRFTTLTDTSAATAPGAVLRVVFKPEMTNAQLQSLVQSVDAQVVSGPTEAGVYTLMLDRLDQGGDSGGYVTHMLERIRADPGVIFAEHVSQENPP